MTAATPTACVAALAATLGAAMLAGCEGEREMAPTSSDRAPRDQAALSEPITVRMGTRDVRVRCAFGCERAREQLTELRDGCVADPISTPHHLDPSRALIALGCCTEAATAYQRACDDATTGPCVSRWSAECDSGRIPSP